MTANTLSALAQLASNDQTTGGPESLEAEQALLGIVMFDNSAFAAVAHLRPGAFAERLHGAMWEVISEKINAGQLAEPIGIMERLRRDPAFEDLGGLRYLADLVDRAPPPSAASSFASTVTDTAVRRGLFTFGARLREFVLATDGQDSGSVLSEVRKALEELEAETALDDTGMVTAQDAAAAAVTQMEVLAESGKAKGRMTGLRCVDRRLGGLRPGALLVLGGRPGMGKTSLGRAIASGAAHRNPNDQFLFIGIEMGPEEMMQRELSALTFEADEPVEYRAMGSGSLTPLELMTIRRVAHRVPSNLILDDCHSLTVEDVRRKVWARRRHGPVGAVVIDYLQLMRRPIANGRNDAAVLGEMTQALKLIARQAQTCIVLLSQLSRNVEYREDKRPQLSDLRESGSIEQDADAVLFPYREFYYVERAEPQSGTNEHVEWEMKCADLRYRLDVICAKQRQGPVGSDRQVYRAECDHISDEREDRR